MALKIIVKDVEFGVGDRIRVIQKISEGDKSRESLFEGMVIAIRGRESGKSFTVRKIAEGSIGVEKIFPLALPTIDRVLVVKKGMLGVRRAKLYYTRAKSPTEVETIFKKSALRGKKVEHVKMKSAKKSRNQKVGSTRRKLRS